MRELQEEDLQDLVRWWSDPAWAVLQQNVVRPKIAESISEMFRAWSRNADVSDVGFSVAHRMSGARVGHVASTVPVSALALPHSL